MIAVFRKRGFDIRTDEAGLVEASKEL